MGSSALTIKSGVNGQDVGPTVSHEDRIPTRGHGATREAAVTAEFQKFDTQFEALIFIVSAIL
jgi:hypothetical protein